MKEGSGGENERRNKGRIQTSVKGKSREKFGGVEITQRMWLA